MLRFSFDQYVKFTGKHVAIQKPKGAGSEYFAYKKIHSINLMAICDSRYRFIMVDIGQCGSESDGGVWNNCHFNDSLHSGEFHQYHHIFNPV